ncbi:hypothetical protein D1007_60152 [Hordeum vulgare]|nr:hypothetical protein D1007_60152 [Hordeum vulgare]
MEHGILDVVALPSCTTIEHVMPCEGHDSPVSCGQLEVPESTMSVVPMVDVVVSVVSVAEHVEAVGMLAPDLLEPSRMLASVDHGGSDVAVTHSLVTVWKVVSMREKVDEILFEL